MDNEQYHSLAIQLKFTALQESNAKTQQKCKFFSIGSSNIYYIYRSTSLFSEISAEAETNFYPLFHAMCPRIFEWDVVINLARNDLKTLIEANIKLYIHPQATRAIIFLL